MKHKSLIAILLSLVMLLTFMPAMAFADGPNPDDGLHPSVSTTPEYRCRKVGDTESEDKYFLPTININETINVEVVDKNDTKHAITHIFPIGEEEYITSEIIKSDGTVKCTGINKGLANLRVFFEGSSSSIGLQIEVNDPNKPDYTVNSISSVELTAELPKCGTTVSTPSDGVKIENEDFIAYKMGEQQGKINIKTPAYANYGIMNLDYSDNTDDNSSTTVGSYYGYWTNSLELNNFTKTYMRKHPETEEFAKKVAEQCGIDVAKYISFEDIFLTEPFEGKLVGNKQYSFFTIVSAPTSFTADQRIINRFDKDVSVTINGKQAVAVYWFDPCTLAVGGTITAEHVYENGICTGCGTREYYPTPTVDNVKNVVDMINVLPAPEDVKVSDESSIKAARDAYDKLNSYQKKDSRLTEPLKKLESCETSLENAKAADEYDSAVAEAKAKKVTLKSVKAKKGRKAVVRWTKAKEVYGYQIYYKAKGVKAKKVTVAKTSTVKKTLKKLKAGKKYSVKVRPYTKIYHPDTGKAVNVYGKWSKVKKVKAKK